ncbi:unnamed protein product [Clavelina lepadiformis]|uniref:MIF4G domain-containing protein n=1 Tax=Clavelina lepadiformis TaxID=159417 RepID=A0ABP0GMS1_CLALP
MEDTSAPDKSVTAPTMPDVKVLREVRSILNKLTRQKFSPLMQKFQKLPINSEQRLREVVDLIFETAINDSMYCEAYANMCRTMSQLRITTPATSGQSQQQTTIVEFRKVLLTRCQREFEKDRQDEEVLSKLRQKLEEATTLETKQQCKEKLEVAETKERRRMLGNIRFIGELFKLKMLTESIMHNCVMSLFKGRNDESLESLCRLLAIIGKDLDHVKGKPRMDQYFQHIDKVIREKKTSSRVRFTLQDVVDLRKSNWVPKAVQALVPKAIDQIHADAKAKKKQLALQSAVEASTAASSPSGKSEKVLREVRSILNKLTPQKFSPLMQKFQQLPINSEQRLREVVDLIFETAINDPMYCEAYANMCRTMSQLRITTPATSGQSQQQTAIVEFRKVLLTRCQREFEKDRQDEEVLSKLRQKLEEATTLETKQQCKEKLEVAETKERRRMLGNIRFIGELFKLKMLTESIMHNCVMSLFKGRNDESLESLCRLLTSIGKDLDHVKGKPRMDQYFQQIDKVIREKKTSSRVRFTLQDVVDLRKSNWVPKAVQALVPKTIDQIHADVKAKKKQLALQSAVEASTAARSPSQEESQK